MTVRDAVLKNDERVALSLRDLYRSFGYTQYKMSKFEEYDLYARNKDFLLSDGVITFTDTNGKLMALKPDVTLSIVKNYKDGAGISKVYYDENVYRISGGSHSYREIKQTGLECLGDIDRYAIVEVLMLAEKSLSRISPDHLLDVSHLDIVSAVIDDMGVSADVRKRLLCAMGEKNLHELSAIAAEAGADVKKSDILRQLVALQGAPEAVLPRLRALFPAGEKAEMVAALSVLVEALCRAGCGEKLRIDFSVIDDMNYYNGIAFKGFVNGVPAAVLSGGQYDRLMQKTGRRAGAIGFAVYLDLLERLWDSKPPYDVDTFLLYDEATDPGDLALAVLATNQGSEEADSTRVGRTLPEGLRYRRLMRLTPNGVEEVKE